LYKVKIDDTMGYIYLIVEHQRTFDEMMPFRLWEYIIRIWNDHLHQTKSKKLPLIIPMVFYNGDKPYDGCRDIRSLINAPSELVDILFQPFNLVDVHEISDEALREQHWAGIVTFVMKYAARRNALSLVEQLTDMLKVLEREQHAHELILMILGYIIVVGETNDPLTFIDTIQKRLSIPVKGELMTMAERLRQEGRQAGESEMLLRQLNYKFGAVPKIYVERIEKADANKLLRWGEKILEASNLQPLFDEV
jgi:predicted transposase/invertase (TIGR01784 family)